MQDLKFSTVILFLISLFSKAGVYKEIRFLTK